MHTWLMPTFGYCEHCCCKRDGAGVSLIHCVQCVWHIRSRGAVGSYGKPTRSVWRSLRTVSTVSALTLILTKSARVSLHDTLAASAACCGLGSKHSTMDEAIPGCAFAL